MARAWNDRQAPMAAQDILYRDFLVNPSLN